MVSREFSDALLGVHHGEQFGEAVFETLIMGAENAEQRFVLGSLLQLETEGKAIMRPVLGKLGLSLETNVARRSEGRASAESLSALPWEEKFAAMAASIRARGLPQYEALATLVSVEEDPQAHRLAEFMATHERAILAVSENIAAGRANPLDPVTRILRFPLEAPRAV